MLQSGLFEYKDEKKRRELQERLKEYDEVSINVVVRPSLFAMYIPISKFPCTS